MVKNLFPIGRVVKPHGVKGKVKAKYFGEDLHLFSLYREIFIEGEKGRPEPYEIIEAIPQPPRLILRLKGIEKIEKAESLIGKEILIKREALPKLEAGEYYWGDILGMRVETQEGKRIGNLKEIFPTGTHDVYVIGGKRRKIFLPPTEEEIETKNLKRGVMKVARMKGFWE